MIVLGIGPRRGIDLVRTSIRYRTASWTTPAGPAFLELDHIRPLRLGAERGNSQLRLSRDLLYWPDDTTALVSAGPKPHIING